MAHIAERARKIAADLAAAEVELNARVARPLIPRGGESRNDESIPDNYKNDKPSDQSAQEM